MFVKGVVMMCSHACLREYSECLLNTSAKSVDELVEPWNVDFVSRPKSVFCMLVVFACMCPCVCVCVCVYFSVHVLQDFHLTTKIVAAHPFSTF